MKRILLSLFLLSLFFSSIFSHPVFADSKSDYEYQLGQYRKNYSEFNLLKQDYLQNPTLNNQQKSILSAKQVLISRDLAKSSYTRYLIELINAQQTAYEALNPTLIRLSAATEFFARQASLSQQIITPADLYQFTTNYLSEVGPHDFTFIFAQSTLKAAQMERFQIDIKAGHQALLPKMPTPLPAPLKARLEEIPLSISDIDSKVASFSKLIIPEKVFVGIFAETYFSPMIEHIVEIRSLQQRLVDQLIDIDLNYGHTKI